MSPAIIAALSHCPCCGRPVRRPRPTISEPAPGVDTGRLSDADVFRHFKCTAPVEDLRFFLQYVRLSPALRADGNALLAVGCRDTGGTLTRTDWYRQLTAIQDRWRRETADGPQVDISEPMAEAV
jgi:hypothetical protein